MAFGEMSQVLAIAVGALATAASAKFIAENAFGWTLDEFKNRRRVRVTMHRAAFIESGREAFFITVTNLSQSREVELSHVWIASEPKVFFDRPDRALPHRLKSDES